MWEVPYRSVGGLARRLCISTLAYNTKKKNNISLIPNPCIIVSAAPDRKHLIESFLRFVACYLVERQKHNLNKPRKIGEEFVKDFEKYPGLKYHEA